MLPFPALNPAEITAEKDTVSRCQNSGSFVPFVSCSPMTSQPFAAQGLSRVSMCPIPLTPLTAAVRTLNVPIMRSSSRGLALAALCFLQADVLSARFPRRFFRANALRLSLSCRYFLPRPSSCLRSSGVMGAAFPASLHFSIVHTSAYSRVPSEYSSSPRFRSHVFRGGGVPTLLSQARVAAGNDFALLGCTPASRCCWQACAISIDELWHQSMSLRDIDSCESSIARTPSTARYQHSYNPSVYKTKVRHYYYYFSLDPLYEHFIIRYVLSLSKETPPVPH